MSEKPVEYRLIPGFPDYRAGDDGSVWSSKPHNGLTGWRRLKTSLARGYPYFNTCCGGKRKTMRVHQAVLLAFVGGRSDGMQGRHKDGNPLNNRLDNLSWGSPKENAADRERHGRQPRSEESRRLKSMTHDPSPMDVVNRFTKQGGLSLGGRRWNVWY